MLFAKNYHRCGLFGKNSCLRCFVANSIADGLKRFFVLFFGGKKCARANFYTFRMSAFHRVLVLNPNLSCGSILISLSYLQKPCVSYNLCAFRKTICVGLTWICIYMCWSFLREIVSLKWKSEKMDNANGQKGKWMKEQRNSKDNDERALKIWVARILICF